MHDISYNKKPYILYRSRAHESSWVEWVDEKEQIHGNKPPIYLYQNQLIGSQVHFPSI